MYDLFLYASFVFFCLYILFLWVGVSRQKYPKGPIPLPLVGNLWTIYQLNVTSEKTCLSLANRYNDLCMLWYGSSPAILINSPHAAHEILHTVRVRSSQVVFL